MTAGAPDAHSAAHTKEPPDSLIPRLLLVGSALSGGGAQTRFRLLAQNLFGASADVAVLQDRDANVLSAWQTLYPLGWAGRPSYPRVLQRLRRAVRTKEYDAVLSFGLHPNTLAWVSLKGLRRRPALVMMEITRPETEARLLGGRLRYAVCHAVRRLTYPGADLCAANSEDGVAEVACHYRVDPQRIRRLPNLVEPERLSRLAVDGDAFDGDSAPSICVVSRLDPLKRIDTLLEAASGLPAGLAWGIDILGDGPDRGRLEALAGNLGIVERVRFHGWTRNPYPAMRRATVTVLTSAYEGFSNTVLESMTLGAPVITSFCSTDARQMSALGAALGFPVGNHITLRSHLARILTDERLRHELRATARRYAERHMIPKALPEYERLVRDAIALRPRSPKCGNRRLPEPER